MRSIDEQPRDEYDEEMVMFLERDQLVADRRQPLPPANIGRRAEAALWLLRIFVLIVGAMVIYTFCAQL
ncbi:MAG: hypothetical protein ACRDLT_10235 [Solirubrobacteraceae bacterium]